MSRARLLEEASEPSSTPFDYIVVGSGAGGGPLAARLALEGRCVLVIEAGVDPATGREFDDPAKQPVDGCAKGVREVYAVPAYHPASTEDDAISWDFSVRHFADEARQSKDSKYEKGRDASSGGKQSKPKGGIFYPRASALGGCTAHHAMVIVRPNDCDWDRIAEKTGDKSWRSENMQGYFAKIEHCLYYRVYKGFLGNLLGGLLRAIQWIYAHISPRRALDPVGHGSSGWQKTSFIDPLVMAGIAKRDRTFLSVLWDVARFALRNQPERSRIARALAWLQIVHFLDPNIRSADFPTRAGGLSLIPIGTDGRCRWGLREHLLAVARKHPDRLVLLTAAHVTRVLFDSQIENGAPRAIGVEVARGLHLYRASPRSSISKETGPREQYFARGEVILCGGTFNTPQVLMLSGIGDNAHLANHKIKGLQDRAGKIVANAVHLPGVGANLQDRYEVSVISQTKKEFSTLKGVTFRVGQEKDVALAQWKRDKTGLYTTNGGAVAMMVSSNGNLRPEPDLFFFGVPAAFRGYYHGWSVDALHKAMREGPDQRNLWSWVILKAYTNNRGTVRLVSPDPFDTPEINFKSFGGPGAKEDLDSLCDGVQKVREINAHVPAFGEEIWPDGSKDLEDWVQDEAWGHHACGTCKIGHDPWRSDPGQLEDRNAVLDSEFRVHGVRGLRVVDASVFPEIPGYFIVTSVFMVAEKAADTLLSSDADYPSALEHEEAAAIHARRNADSQKKVPAAAPTTLPQDTVGIALSGGGIRSATFCLGVLQALAASGKLRRVDFLSTVSGGGYIGAFLGRLYMRLNQGLSNKAARVEDVLIREDSPELWWLRRNADYANSAGRIDFEVNLAIIARNLLAVHLVVAALLFGVLGGLRWLAHSIPGDLVPSWAIWGIELSFWWWVPLFILCVLVAPLAVGYWLAPSPAKTSAVVPLLVWLVLLSSALYGLGVPGASLWSGVAIGVLLLAWVLRELAERRQYAGDGGADAASARRMTGSAAESVSGTLLRNRFTRALGIALLALMASLFWVVLDSLAQLATSPEMMPATGWSMLAFAPVLLVVRMLANRWIQRTPEGEAVDWYGTARKAIINGLGFVLAVILLFFIDALAHLAFNASQALGFWTAITALAVSVIAGRWLVFLNLSSLQQSYAQKLVRTFLGATNDARVHPKGANAPLPVEIASPDDDLFFDHYHAEQNGGPLHLINVCVNDTVVSESGRKLREDKGLPMCIGPAGVSVGCRYHALWEADDEAEIDAAVSSLARSFHALRRVIKGRARLTVRPLPVAPDPNAFHVLARSDGDKPAVERLRVGQWLSISGAAVAPGTGRFTTVAQSLFLGLVNFRLGYWWDSGIRAGQRPGRYPPNLWRRLKSFPASVFRMQTSLLNEWRGYFAGPAERLWYLSDGGHFDHTALYELIRRRLPFIIAVDGGDDPKYRFDDLAVLTRQVRLDFGAEIEWLDATAITKVPAWIQKFFNPSAVGKLSKFKRDGRFCSMLGRITYRADRERTSWVLLVKPNLAPKLPVDLRNYADRHLLFPNESTANQFFSDEQWESYRKLGQCVGAMVFGKRIERASSP